MRLRLRAPASEVRVSEFRVAVAPCVLAGPAVVLALSLDPYPRSAGADAALKEAGVMSEAEASPFAVLAKLKKDKGS